MPTPQQSTAVNYANSPVSPAVAANLAPQGINAGMTNAQAAAALQNQVNQYQTALSSGNLKPGDIQQYQNQITRYNSYIAQVNDPTLYDRQQAANASAATPSMANFIFNPNAAINKQYNAQNAALTQAQGGTVSVPTPAMIPDASQGKIVGASSSIASLSQGPSGTGGFGSPSARNAALYGPAGLESAVESQYSATYGSISPIRAQNLGNGAYQISLDPMFSKGGGQSLSTVLTSFQSQFPYASVKQGAGGSFILSPNNAGSLTSSSPVQAQVVMNSGQALGNAGVIGSQLQSNPGINSATVSIGGQQVNAVFGLSNASLGTFGLTTTNPGRTISLTQPTPATGQDKVVINPGPYSQGNNITLLGTQTARGETFSQTPSFNGLDLTDGKVSPIISPIYGISGSTGKVIQPSGPSSSFVQTQGSSTVYPTLALSTTTTPIQKETSTPTFIPVVLTKAAYEELGGASKLGLGVGPGSVYQPKTELEAAQAGVYAQAVPFQVGIEAKYTKRSPLSYGQLSGLETQQAANEQMNKIDLLTGNNAGLSLLGGAAKLGIGTAYGVAGGAYRAANLETQGMLGLYNLNNPNVTKEQYQLQGQQFGSEVSITTPGSLGQQVGGLALGALLFEGAGKIAASVLPAGAPTVAYKLLVPAGTAVMIGAPYGQTNKGYNLAQGIGASIGAFGGIVALGSLNKQETPLETLKPAKTYGSLADTGNVGLNQKGSAIVTFTDPEAGELHPVNYQIVNYEAYGPQGQAGVSGKVLFNLQNQEFTPLTGELNTPAGKTVTVTGLVQSSEGLKLYPEGSLNFLNEEIPTVKYPTTQAYGEGLQFKGANVIESPTSSSIGYSTGTPMQGAEFNTLLLNKAGRTYNFGLEAIKQSLLGSAPPEVLKGIENPIIRGILAPAPTPTYDLSDFYIGRAQTGDVNPSKAVSLIQDVSPLYNTEGAKVGTFYTAETTIGQPGGNVAGGKSFVTLIENPKNAPSGIGAPTYDEALGGVAKVDYGLPEIQSVPLVGAKARLQVVSQGTPVSQLTYSVDSANNQIFIEGVKTSPSYQGRGYASDLVGALQTSYPDFTLKTSAGSEGGRGLFTSQGFQQKGSSFVLPANTPPPSLEGVMGGVPGVGLSANEVSGGTVQLQQQGLPQPISLTSTQKASVVNYVTAQMNFASNPPPVSSNTMGASFLTGAVSVSKQSPASRVLTGGVSLTQQIPNQQTRTPLLPFQPTLTLPQQRQQPVFQAQRPKSQLPVLDLRPNQVTGGDLGLISNQRNLQRPISITQPRQIDLTDTKSFDNTAQKPISITDTTPLTKQDSITTQIQLSQQDTKPMTTTNTKSIELPPYVPQTPFTNIGGGGINWPITTGKPGYDERRGARFGRRFKYTPDIFSIEMNIRSTKYPSFAALSATGIRPILISTFKRGKKR